MAGCFLLLFCSFMSFLPSTPRALDKIATSQVIEDGKTLTSAHGTFELGFFSPNSYPDKRYVGIWYNNIPAKTVVWVANRERPLLDSTGVLKLSTQYGLVLVNGTGGIVWCTNSSRPALNPVAQLLDSGNLVVRDKDDQNSENYLWQSFDHPSHVQLPGMKVGWDLVRDVESFLTSWETIDDPSPGPYTYRVDRRGCPEIVIMKGDVEEYRSGPWNGVTVTGNPKLRANSIFTPLFVFNDKEMYSAFDLVNNSVLCIKVLKPDGVMQSLIWNDNAQGWITYLNPESDNCELYAFCGPFGSCGADTSSDCACLRGFEPKVPKNWDAGEWTDGCVRRTHLSCKGDGFIKYSNVKLPDTQYSWYNTSMTLDQCRKICLQNCSCLAYSTLDVRRGGSGCLLWFDVLIDIRVIPVKVQDIYVRVAASELGKGKAQIWIVVSATVIGILLLSIGIMFYVWKQKRVTRKVKTITTEDTSDDNNKKELELPSFPLNVIAHATNNFADFNKLGEGGFGPVYKGVLKGGKEIAVKRLSQASRQGHEAFRNEVKCIAKLQHRNLVNLAGCCSEAEEQLLIYEYMPNKSLDTFIFDKTRSMLLDWTARFNIICGVARGLLYLHQESRLRIIHRDLKASNILLDSQMNPKISDFGMARMLDGNACGGKTKIVVGTYGYMSPEYAIDGLFSMKSDVFSFGVLVLEIVSGKRNRAFNHLDHHHNLLGHAWRLFKEGQTLDLVEQSISQSAQASQVLRSVQVGLLCVQEDPNERPDMSQVIVMLGDDSELPWPKQPGFYYSAKRVAVGVGELVESHSNEVTITVLLGR